MKVKINQPMAGPDGAYRAGEIVELDDKTAKKLIETGQAQEVDKKDEKKDG
jgi:hypothetical protein